jgi:hypothetical protein
MGENREPMATEIGQTGDNLPDADSWRKHKCLENDHEFLKFVEIYGVKKVPGPSISSNK